MGQFGGFPIAGLDFYEDLEADNSKTFWAAHKQVYEQAVRAPMLALTEELSADFGPAKLFRPYRDVRFSKDKSPYKTAQGAVVATAPGVGWYVQIGAPGLFVAAGFYSGTSEQLSRLRSTIDDAVRGEELAGLLAELETAGHTISGDQLKTKPKGYSADHPRIDLLRYKTLHAVQDFGAPDWLETPEAAARVRDVWEQQRPLVDWLTAVLDELPDTTGRT